MPAIKAARRLGLTEAVFLAKLPDLQRRRFPAADPDTGLFDLKAIDAWMDLQAGLANEAGSADAVTDFAERLGALGGQGKRR